VYRTPKGFRVIGKIKQPLDTFRMPVDLRIDTEGNPEQKTIDVIGTESGFTVETFGRPKPGGIKVDPNNVILKGSVSLRARAAPSFYRKLRRFVCEGRVATGGTRDWLIP